MNLEKKVFIVRSSEDRRKFHSIKYFLKGGVERRVTERRNTNQSDLPDFREAL